MKISWRLIGQNMLKRWWLILLFFVIPLVISLLYTMLIASEEYENSVTVTYTISQKENPEASYDRNAEINIIMDNMIKLYFPNDKVTGALITELKKDSYFSEILKNKPAEKNFLKNFKVEQQGTFGIKFTFASNDKEIPTKVINALVPSILDELRAVTNEFYEREAIEKGAITEQPLQEALKLEQSPTNSLLLSAVIGVLLTGLFFILPPFLSTKVKTIEQFEEIFEGDVLGRVPLLCPKDETGRKRPAFVPVASDATNREYIKEIAVKTGFVFEKDMKAIGVAGIATGDGATTISSNLSNIIKDEFSVFLAKAEDIAAIGFKEFVDEKKADYDKIVIDIPPINEDANSLLYANCVDGLILVVKADTKRADIIKALKSLEISKSKVLGTVFNKAR